MRLMQVRKGRNGRQVVATEGDESWFVDGFDSVYDLAHDAIASGIEIEELVGATKAPARRPSPRRCSPPAR